MRTKYIPIFILSMLVIPYGKLSAQMVVTDPGVLGTINTQIGIQSSAYTKELAESIKHTQNLINTVKTLEQQKDAITGNLILNSVLEASFEALLSNYENLNDPLPSQRIGGTYLDTKNASDVKKLLTEKIYSTQDDKRQGVYRPLMKKYHSDSSQAALQLAQVVISNATDDIEKVKETARKADSNQELKEAVDVNNNLLVQLVTTQNEIKQLLAQLVRSQVSKDFQGTTTKAVKLEKTNLERIKGSTKNSSNDVFKIKDRDMPFKRRGTSTVDKFFNSRGR